VITPSTPFAARLKHLNLETALWEGRNLTLTVPDSQHCRVRNRPGIRTASGG
jgi:hypothetical protein